MAPETTFPKNLAVLRARPIAEINANICPVIARIFCTVSLPRALSITPAIAFRVSKNI
jgi:hypothetical protein